MKPFPTFAELERRGDSGLPVSWGVWGTDDQLGMLNNITPEAARDAAALVKRGVRFNLDLPVHLPYGVIKPEAHVFRKAPTQTLYQREIGTLMVRDDKVDDLYLQGSTQWDGLTHIGDGELNRFYNGVKSEQITQREGTRNGIEHLANFGIATRGVLVDLVRHFAATGRDWDLAAQQKVSAQDVQACLAAQKVTLRQGDVLLVRMGWVRALLDAPDLEARDALVRPWSCSGLSGNLEMWEFLWNARIGALAADTPAVECMPFPEGQPTLHLAIARLGITLGEMFDLEALAEDCAADGCYAMQFVSSPLNLRGGVGSPPNAMAIK
jgi:hypothetical protein